MPDSHNHSDPADVEVNGAAAAYNLVLTVNHHDVAGELGRWVVDDGEVGYEVRVEGLDDSPGIHDVV